MDTKKYVEEAMRQLNNTTHYETIPSNPLHKINKEINTFIDLLYKHKHIDMVTRDAIIINTLVYPVYTYYLKSTRLMSPEDRSSQQHKAPRTTSLLT